MNEAEVPRPYFLELTWENAEREKEKKQWASSRMHF
jgi:hypothetical protein